jgi:DNA-binding GntR family transcriptional regulator
MTVSRSLDAATGKIPVAARERLVRKTAVELVVDDLRARILSGELPPGSALRQEALAEELGVSRIPLREAMHFLSSDGLVDHVPHKGTYVSMISVAEVREFFDLRLRLEPWLLHEAVQVISVDELADAERIVDAMDTCPPDQWGKLNWALHEVLYKPAGRPAAMNIIRSIHEKSERYFRFQIVNADIRQHAREDHRELIDLCRYRQADKAEAAMVEHIVFAAEQISDIVSRILKEPALVYAA